MKQSVLARYEKTDDNKVIIDVTASQTEDLYDNYDKNTPYIRRDLDQNLVDYLIDSAKEVCPEPFVISFTLNEPPNKEGESRICKSMNAYFLYLTEIELENITQMFRRSAILFGIGLSILFIAILLNQALGENSSVVANVFAEGLTIAAWVSLWESIAFLLLEWFPHRKKVRIYKRLADAKIIFKPDVMQNKSN